MAIHDCIVCEGQIVNDLSSVTESDCYYRVENITKKRDITLIHDGECANIYFGKEYLSYYFPRRDDAVLFSRAEHCGLSAYQIKKIFGPIIVEYFFFRMNP